MGPQLSYCSIDFWASRENAIAPYTLAYTRMKNADSDMFYHVGHLVETGQCGFLTVTV